MMCKIIYLHGFNSGKKSATADKLLGIFNDAIIAEYNTLDPIQAEAQISQIIEAQDRDHELILVGTSLGGFWAQYFAAKYQLKALLVNPAINPAETLKQMIGEVKNYSTGAVGTLTAENVSHYRPFTDKFGGYLSVIVYTGDELLPYQATVTYFKKHRVQIIQGGSHRIASITDVAKEVKYLSGVLMSAQTGN
jgi:predicted esterase YcpF (UPF0227 family)